MRSWRIFRRRWRCVTRHACTCGSKRISASPIPPLASADEALTRYASTTHAIGVRLTADDNLDIYAPFGLQDVFEMVVRPNHALPNQATHERKGARALAIWPQLEVIPWDAQH